MNRWHAVDALDETVERTKYLLLPFNLRFWLKLALVVLLAGGLSGGNWGRMTDLGKETTPSPGVLAFAMVFVAAILFIALIFWYVSAVARFIFVEALAKREFNLVECFKRQAGNGLKLFLFEVAVVISLIVLVVAAIIAGVTFFQTIKSTIAMIAIGLAAFLAGLVVLTCVLLVMWLVSEFTVPIMYGRGCGIISGVKEALTLASRNFWEFTVYSIIKFAFSIAGAIITLLVGLPFYIAVFLIALAVGVGAYVIALLGNLTLTPFVAALIIAGVVALVIVQLIVSYIVTALTLPISVFLRYYSLIFLGRIAPTLNLMGPAKKKPEGDEAIKKEEKVKVY
ncbi:MAG: hypothetical protein V1744_03305 [Candidatus Altiarchaeota archaeon]